MEKFDFAHVNFAQPEVAAGLAQAYRILLERAYRRRQPTRGAMQCSDAQESVAEKTTDDRESGVADNGETEEIGEPAMKQDE